MRLYNCSQFRFPPRCGNGLRWFEPCSMERVPVRSRVRTQAKKFFVQGRRCAVIVMLPVWESNRVCWFQCRVKAAPPATSSGVDNVKCRHPRHGGEVSKGNLSILLLDMCCRRRMSNLHCHVMHILLQSVYSCTELCEVWTRWEKQVDVK